jgi:uncharacterized repeat protein (TIGR01451 family)
MKHGLPFPTLLALILLLSAASMSAESHRATRLGNPATRFADPLYTPEDLRARFRDPRLRPDFASVLRQWGWQGNINDMFAAAATGEVREVRIPIGDVMPFMSSREGGRAICLRNVTWAGQEPAPAYAFNFTSSGRQYRCVTPKACSNFFLEDLGAEPRHGYALDCNVTTNNLVGRNIQTCLTIQNTGNVLAPAATVTLPYPPNAVLTGTTAGGRPGTDAITWLVTNLAPGAVQQVCAVFKAGQPGPVSFRPSIASANARPMQSACDAVVTGISALLLENADDPDPVGVGESTVYTVKVTNQGTAEDTNVRLVVEFPAELDPVTASDAGEIAGKTVKFPVVARLAPKEAFQYKITAKGVQAGDARIKFIRTSEQIPAPTTSEESTHVY